MIPVTIDPFDDDAWSSGFSGEISISICNGFVVRFTRRRTPLEHVSHLPTGLTRNGARRTWRVSLSHQEGRFQRYFSDRQFSHDCHASFEAALASLKEAYATLCPAPTRADSGILCSGPNKRTDFDTEMPGLRVQVERRKPSEISVSVIVEQMVMGNSGQWVHKTVIGTVSSSDFKLSASSALTRYEDLLKRGAQLREAFNRHKRYKGYPPYPLSIESFAGEDHLSPHYKAPALQPLFESQPAPNRRSYSK